jgi:hypothetical protein
MIPIIKTWPTCVYKIWLTSLFPEKLWQAELWTKDIPMIIQFNGLAWTLLWTVFVPWWNLLAFLTSFLLRTSSLLTYDWASTILGTFYTMFVSEMFIFSASELHVSKLRIGCIAFEDLLKPVLQFLVFSSYFCRHVDL